MPADPTALARLTHVPGMRDHFQPSFGADLFLWDLSSLFELRLHSSADYDQWIPNLATLDLFPSHV